MIDINNTLVMDRVRDVTPFEYTSVPAPYSVLVVRDAGKSNEYLDSICEFLDIGVEHATSGDDLGPVLHGLRPMAVIADLESDRQDGFNVMKIVAGYDQALPVMLLTNNDPALLGAVDAVRELWGLTRVTTDTGRIGALVDFICHAARNAGRTRMMRA
jgi:DNA-binding NtrC family response regulator